MGIPFSLHATHEWKRYPCAFRPDSTVPLLRIRYFLAYGTGGGGHRHRTTTTSVKICEERYDRGLDLDFFHLVMTEIENSLKKGYGSDDSFLHGSDWLQTSPSPPKLNNGALDVESMES
jgi:hypothetical protein